jgi:hypothetical protein
MYSLAAREVEQAHADMPLLLLADVVAAARHYRILEPLVFLLPYGGLGRH